MEKVLLDKDYESQAPVFEYYLAKLGRRILVDLKRGMLNGIEGDKWEELFHNPVYLYISKSYRVNFVIFPIRCGCKKDGKDFPARGDIYNIELKPDYEMDWSRNGVNLDKFTVELVESTNYRWYPESPAVENIEQFFKFYTSTLENVYGGTENALKQHYVFAKGEYKKSCQYKDITNAQICTSIINAQWYYDLLPVYAINLATL